MTVLRLIYKINGNDIRNLYLKKFIEFKTSYLNYEKFYENLLV